MMSGRRKISESVRRRVADMAQHRCSYCQSPEIVGIPMLIDHIIPLSEGGNSSIENLCLAWSRDGLHVIGLTACGRATVETLHLNDLRLMQARRIWRLVSLHPPLD